MAIIPVADFNPDAPDMPAGGTDVAYNVIPTTKQSYGPLPSHQPLSSALNARCQGGLTVSDNNGNVSVFAGDATKLYQIPSPGTTPNDISRPAGYLTAPGIPWEFTALGRYIIATNGVDKVQGFAYDGSATQFSDLITSGVTSLRAKYCAVVRNHLFLGHTIDDVNGTQSQRVHWSAVKDPTNFPTPGTQLAAANLSDFQDQPGAHGALQGIAGNLGTSDGATFFERAVWRIIYTGLPDIYDFIPAEGARGLLISGGLNQFGSNVYYPTEDGFYAFDGSNSAPIGKGRIDRFFYDDLQTTYLDRVCSTVDPARGLLIWAYPGAGASNGVCNRLLIYSPSFDKWTVTDATSTQIEYLLRGATFGKTLEQLDAYGNIDTLQFSLDSQVWIGNRSVLSGFTPGHRFGYFDGPNLAATMDTTDLEPVPGFRSQTTRVRPLTDTSACTISCGVRETLTTAVAFGAALPQEPNGSCAVRGAGRYQRYRAFIPAGTTWKQFSGVDVEEFSQLGRR